jgi:hypothetical protein
VTPRPTFSRVEPFRQSGRACPRNLGKSEYVETVAIFSLFAKKDRGHLAMSGVAQLVGIAFN